MDIENELAKALSDPEIMNKVGGILSSLSANSQSNGESPATPENPLSWAAGASQDDRTRLLMAIKPFLSEKRAPYMDSAVMLLRLAKMGKIAELFK